MSRGGGSRLRVTGVLLVFAATFTTLSVIAQRQKSGTWDEPMHLASGYAALTEGNYLVDPAHPPFARMWAAIPLLAMPGLKLDRSALNRSSNPEWPQESYEFARRFLYVDNDAGRLLFASRNMVIVWGAVLGLLLFAWANEWLGFVPAVVALAFYALEPNLAAHSSLATTDMAVTCAMFGAVYFLWRVCRHPAPVNVAGLAVFSSLTIVSKFSGLILVPVLLVLLILSVARWRTIPLRRAAVIVLVLGASAYLSVWAVYGFRYAPTAAATARLEVDQSPMAQQNSPWLTAAVGWVDRHRLLPNAFSQGLLHSQATSRELPAYLAGEYSTSGWWYYFPAAFALKTPLSLLLMFAAGIVVWARRRLPDSVNIWFVVVPVAVYLGIAMTSGINIGVRHILPVYPFVLLVATIGGAALLASRRLVARAGFAAATAIWVIVYAAVYPYTLTFFSAAVGGPEQGFRYLSDSNVDWGQHLKLLDEWMDEHQVGHVNLAYFGTADPAYYGIACTHLPGGPTFAIPLIMRPQLPGYVALTATVASGVYLDSTWRLFYRPFRDRQPDAVLGNSIRVYWVDTWPEPSDVIESAEDIDAHGMLADALLFGLNWVDQAIAHYRTYLRHRPQDAAATMKLGTALASQGHADEAASVLRRAVELAPHSGQANRLLAQVLLTSGQSFSAAAYAKRAVELTPADPAAHDVLGVSLVLTGRRAQARREFERAVALDPNYAPAREHLARLGTE